VLTALNDGSFSLTSTSGILLYAAAGSAVAAALMGVVLARRAKARETDLLSRLEGPESKATVEERLAELSKTMQRSALLVEQVSAELDARAATARQLQEDAKTAEALAALHKDQADAVRRMIDAELAVSTRRIHSDSIKIGIVSFVAGGFLTLAVTLFVHPFH
jgi:hypothetical protein